MAAEAKGHRSPSFRLRSVRARTTAGATLVVAIALAGSAWGLVTLTERTLRHSVEEAVRLRAGELAASLTDGSADPATLPNEEDVIVQILDGTRVVASSPAVEGKPPMARLQAGQTAIVTGPADEGDDSFMVAAESARTSTGTITVLVGRNLDTVRESVSVVTGILAVGLPILLVVVGIITWVVVGRALAPVEAIRQGVSEISGTQLQRRVPIPPGDDEIARLASTMNAMLARLEEARDRQRRLVSDASHELRSPIAAIRQHAEVTLSHPDATTVDRLAADVLAEDLRLERLAEDLLLLARADESSLQPKGRPLDLDDLALEEARRLRQTTQLRIDTSDVSAARTRGDRQQLQRVVRNLADNAARHAASAIRLGVREDDGRAILEVDDDGPGVPPERRRVVFERFTRLDDARDRRRGGAGLGLAIVTEIVSAHGGTVTVGDAPLGGARFRVILPTLVSQPPDGASGPRSPV
jgi:signal transduction histidine kinase